MFFFLHYLRDENNQRSIGYASENQLRILSHCDQWHMDGTFDAASIFYQLYILYGWYKGEMYPCAYIFLENKTSETYQKVFHHLANNPYGYNLKPKTIMSDFESGLIAAVRVYYNNTVQHLGCHFHYANALVKNIALVGLKTGNYFWI